MHREADDETTGSAVDPPSKRRSAAGCGSNQPPLIAKDGTSDGKAMDPAGTADELPPQSR